MTPLYLGSGAEPLYGLYGPPRAQQDREEAVVLCAPVAHEYIRTHWAMRMLADQLLTAGYHVLRFDYSCQGDSWGSFEQASVARWAQDVETAVTELADTSGAAKISVVALRLGAPLALAAAGRVALNHLVLWDPVLVGKRYVTELRFMQKQLRHVWTHAPLFPAGAEFEDLLGYHYSKALIREIEGLEMEGSSATGLRARRVSVFAEPTDDVERLRKSLQDRGARVEVHATRDRADWNDVSRFGEPILLGGTRRVIGDLLGEAAS